MAGTTWPTLVAGARAKASEVEAKFDWIEQDLVPMAGGSKADATYDLGQSTFRWRDAYVSRQWLGPQGSVGTPAFSFQSRTTDGWYSPASNQMGLALGGSQWLNHRDNSGTTHTDGGQSWTYGIDPADSNAWKVSVGSDLSTVTAIKITTTGEVMRPLQPYFSAYIPSEIANATGDGTDYTLTSWTELFDQGSDFNATTGIFTAPITGLYSFYASVSFNDFTSSVTGVNLVINTSSQAYGNGGYQFPPNVTNASFVANFKNQLDINLTAGDNVYVYVAAIGTTKTVDIDAGSSTRPTRFSGRLV